MWCSGMEKEYLPKRAKVVAAALVESLPNNRDDRMFCRRLSILPTKWWTPPMVRRFDQLASVHRPDLAINPLLITDDPVDEKAYSDAQKLEREYCSMMRPYIRVNHDGIVWIGPQKNVDEHTMNVTRSFNVQFLESSAWLVSSSDEQNVIKYALENDIPVSAGAAEHAAANLSIKVISETPVEQLTLLDPHEIVASAGVTHTGHPKEGHGEQESEVVREVDGQYSFLLEDPDVPQSPLTIDYDGQNIVVVGDVTPATREHLKRVSGIQWNGRERMWFIPPIKANSLFHAATLSEWEITDTAQQAHDDAMEEVRIRDVERELARERSRALTPIQEVAVPGLNKSFSLRPYQQAGIEAAVSMRRAILADDVGLGKTVQALSSVAVTESLPAIVVAKASLKLNWHHEISELFGWSTFIVEGRTSQPIPEVDVVIINPESSSE
jgi:hypothetical protein